MCHANNEKRTEKGIKLSDQEKPRTRREKDTNKYLRILEADTIKQVEMKEKIKQEYLNRKRKLLEIKLQSKNLILKVRRTSANGPENNKTHDNATGLTS